MPEFSPFTKTIIDEIQKDSKVAGEECNIAALFYSLITNEYNESLRIHTLIDSTTGSGKSTLASAVLKAFPKEQLIDADYLTRAGITRFGSLKGKIFYLHQSFGNEPNVMLGFMTEGKITIIVAGKEEGTNKMVSQTITLEGMPSIISTTTSALSPEYRRRFLTLTIDESVSQTERVLHAQGMKFYELPKSSINEQYEKVKAILKRVHESNPSEKVTTVVIPFIQSMESGLPKKLQLRSDYPHFLNLIASIALTKSLCGDNGRCLYDVEPEIEGPGLKAPLKARIAIASKEDYQDAWVVAGRQSFDGLNYQCRAILDYLRGEKESIIGADGKSVESCAFRTKKQIQNACDIKQTTAQENLKILQERGLIDTDTSQNAHQHRFSKDPTEIAFQVEDIRPEDYLAGRKFAKVGVESV